MEFGDLPALQDAVTVVGYPIGGDTISVTSGVVSRMEILSYVHGSTELLGLQVVVLEFLSCLTSKVIYLYLVIDICCSLQIPMQIDAAINSGNSGGPAFSDKGKCVGIAFQSLKHEDVENIGYVIPTPVILHFIRDYEKNGAYTGAKEVFHFTVTNNLLSLLKEKKKGGGGCRKGWETVKPKGVKWRSLLIIYITCYYYYFLFIIFIPYCPTGCYDFEFWLLSVFWDDSSFYLNKLDIFFLGSGFPILGVEWQKMENPDLRKSMGMRPDQKGVRIRRIEPTAPESYVLKPSDIILSFDGINIANDGTGNLSPVLAIPLR